VTLKGLLGSAIVNDNIKVSRGLVTNSISSTHGLIIRLLAGGQQAGIKS